MGAWWAQPLEASLPEGWDSDATRRSSACVTTQSHHGTIGQKSSTRDL